MIRYLRLYAYCVAFSCSRAFEFRADFWLRIIMDVIFYILAIALFKTFYLHTPTLGDFNESQAMVFVAAFCLIDGLQMTFYSNGTWWLHRFINRGDLDYYLVRPVSTLFFITFREFSLSSMINLIIAVGLLVWSLSIYPEPLSAWKIIYGSLLILNGAFLFFIVRIIIIIPSFWTLSGEGLTRLFLSLREALEKPDGIFRNIFMRGLLLYILPFGLMASFPTRVFFEDFNPWRLGHIVGVTAGLFLVLLWLWNRGLRAYSSASS